MLLFLCYFRGVMLLSSLFWLNRYPGSKMRDFELDAAIITYGGKFMVKKSNNRIMLMPSSRFIVFSLCSFYFFDILVFDFFILFWYYGTLYVSRWWMCLLKWQMSGLVFYKIDQIISGEAGVSSSSSKKIRKSIKRS